MGENSKSNELSAKGLRGRGAAENPANRFDAIDYQPDPDAEFPDRVPTTYYRDHSKTIIAYNQSPDVGFDAGINPYRGCEHGCIYCYARPYHEYLGLSAGLDFETKIFVKEDAPELLRKELSAKKWRPQVVALSGATDCYQPAEKKFQITRRCLEVFAEFHNPVAVITKNHLVTRDIDVLKQLAEHDAVTVYLSVTTLDSQLARNLEPRTSTPRDRLAAIEDLAQAGIPVGVMAAPVIPAITDPELPAILNAAARAGARWAGYILLRLPHGVSELFSHWLDRHFPERKEKVLHRLRELREGKLNSPEFGKRMRGQGIFAEQVHQMFEIACRKSGLNREKSALTAANFKRPEGPQMGLFTLGSDR